MAGWRFMWVAKMVLNLENYKKQKSSLENPHSYYKALFLKLLPGIHKYPVHLKLEKGGQFLVNSFMTLYIYHEIFIDNVYDHEHVGKKDPVIIDIGSNTGLFVLRMKQIYPDSRIFCFEPCPSNYSELVNMIKLNKFNNVTAIEKGIGGLSRKEKMYIHPRNLGGHSISKKFAGGDFIEIELIDIRKALDYTPAGSCDLLKLDCEGAEYEILKSFDFDLAKKITRIIYEPTAHLYSIEELNTHIINLGYSVESIKGIYFAEYRGK